VKPVPLFGEGINAYSPTVSRQRRLNCFYDVRKDQDKNTAILRGTPGSVLAYVLPTGPIRGWQVVGNLLYVVSGLILYSVTSGGTVTSLGTIAVSSSPFVDVTDNGVQLGIVDGNTLYVYTLVTGVYKQTALNAAGSFGAVVDANFPAGATSLAFLDGRCIANKVNTRQAYVCEQYDLTNWTNVSSLPTYMTKENSSDQLVAIDVLNGVIVLWGAGSIEYWQDVGSAPNPFARVNGATQTWGLAAVNSRQPLNNTMIFLGQNPQGTLQVMMLQGYTPTRVSTSDIEDIITSFAVWKDATSLTYIVAGHPMYQLNFPTANRSFLYDSLTNIWQEVQTGLELQARHIANIGIAFNSKNVIADSTSGGLYVLDANALTDNGTPIKRQVVSRHVHFEGNEIGIDELFLDMETGVGLQTGRGSDPQIMLQVSKDGGRTFGTERWVKIGKVGHYATPRVIWRRLGMSRDFVFQFTMTDPVKFTVLRGSITPRGQEGKTSGQQQS